MTTDLTLPNPSTIGPNVSDYQPYSVETFGDLVQTVSFRLKDGSQFAKPYHWLGELSFDPSTGIMLQFSDAVITITGRNLHTVYPMLCDYKVRWLHEADRPTALTAPDSATVIESIRKSAFAGRR